MAGLLLVSMSRRRPLCLTLVELRDADRPTLAAHPIAVLRVGGFAGGGAVTIELYTCGLLGGAPDLWQHWRQCLCGCLHAQVVGLSYSGHHNNVLPTATLRRVDNYLPGFRPGGPRENSGFSVAKPGWPNPGWPSAGGPASEDFLVVGASHSRRTSHWMDGHNLQRFLMHHAT